MKFAAFALFLAIFIAACSATEAKVVDKEFILTTSFEEGEFAFIGVGDEINGVKNPILNAKPGETITITLINGGEGKHSIVFPPAKASSEVVHEKGEEASITFTVPNSEGEWEYYDGVGNNAELGLKGFVAISAVEVAQAAPAADNPLFAAFQKGGCGACHGIPGIPNAVGVIGPDMAKMNEVAAARIADSAYTGEAKTAEEYIRESILNPDAFVVADCPSSACQKGLMPSTLKDTLAEEEINTIVGYLATLPGGEAAIPAPETSAAPVVASAANPSDIALSDEDFAWAKQTFFERCAGCHGTLRKGATGPALTPDVTLTKGTVALSAIIYNGTPKGMPDWGKQGFFTQEQTDIMAKYLQNEPPAPPDLSLEQMKESWKVFVAPEDRPTAPQTTRNWENYFSVTLRDAGQVAIIDGDTYEIVAKVDTGYAVHITRMSATGRYAYVIGRDGKLALVDLWMEIPAKVAEVQTCYDARSVEVSKYNGELGDFTDKYAIVGCYWPPHFTILDGQTLEPFKVIGVRGYTADTNTYVDDPRVASILASTFKPEWIVNIKETGQVWMVNYTDPMNPTIKMISSALYLHDGGWNSTKRYFMVAANQSNKIVVIDALEGDLEAMVDTPQVPHPGRGANWIDPVYGPVWSTSHLSSDSLIAIGTDPEGNPDSAWKVVRDIKLPGAGSLFIKTHPNSQWIWADMVLNSDEKLQRTICVIAKADPTKTHKCWEASDYGRAVHIEYNMDGTQVWVSIWGTADVPGKTGEIVIYDDATLEELFRIKDLITPTGKFNVHNTVHEVY
ncbi:MAG: c-type cytochrome, partial [Chloroflexi bacterium]|nr:c-type cytochrome [Chloroflexota bacterium]